MWSPFKIGKAIGSVAKGANGIIQTIKGSELDRDKQYHGKYLASQEALIAEYQDRSNRTLWDSLWDGFNRMPRPMIVLGIFFYFGLAYVNPAKFQIVNIALETVPEYMWWVMSAIITYYFAARELQKNREKKLALSKQEFFDMQARIKAIQEPEKSYEESEPEGLPHINPSVDAWKREEFYPDL